jgi:NhaA family Na+:H+ antiporter
MANRPTILDPPVDVARDHILGPHDAALTLVEYGSYASAHSHTVHDLIVGLRRRFGERIRYAFRHLPVVGNETARRAAELAEYAAAASGQFWEVHEELIEGGSAIADDDIERIARDLNLPTPTPDSAAKDSALAAIPIAKSGELPW